jgi:hypothetical protein
VLGRVSGKQIERLAPGSQGGARVSGVAGTFRFGSQALELIRMDEALARWAREQRRRYLRATLRADGRRLPACRFTHDRALGRGVRRGGLVRSVDPQRPTPVQLPCLVEGDARDDEMEWAGYADQDRGGICERQ